MSKEYVSKVLKYGGVVEKNGVVFSLAFNGLCWLINNQYEFCNHNSAIDFIMKYI